MFSQDQYITERLEPESIQRHSSQTNFPPIVFLKQAANAIALSKRTWHVLQSCSAPVSKPIQDIYNIGNF
jgi:hypothetical protein